METEYKLSIFIVLLLVLISVVSTIIISNSYTYTIMKNQTIVKSLTACCVGEKDKTNLNILGMFRENGSTKYIPNDISFELCIPKEDNSFNLSCKDISSKELNKEWLDKNCGCVEYNCLGKECNKGDCLIYEFGGYEIEKS